MAANTTPIFPGTPASAVVQFANADGATAKQIYAPAGTNGARVVAMTLTNTDTAAYTFQLFLRKSTTSYLIGSIPLVASAGNLGTVGPAAGLPSIAALSGNNPFLYDAYGNIMFYLDSAAVLWGAMTTTITSGKLVNVVTFAEEW